MNPLQSLLRDKGGESWKIAGEELPPEKIVENAKSTECKSIVYTYTEPTMFFEYAFDTAKLARVEGIKKCLCNKWLYKH